MNIKLNDIIPAPWNTRGEITPASVAELAASIGEQGLINPITLWRSEDGAWYCIAGNRRLAALKLHYEPNAHLTALNRENYTIFSGSADEARMVTVTENLQREDVSPIEEAALVEQCLNGGMTAEDIAAKTGRSASWVNRRKKLVALAPAWKQHADRFTAGQLERIAAYPLATQEAAAKMFSPATAQFDQIKYALERDSRDLATAKFDTATCRECWNRTGADDLFGVTDGLGKCMCKKCYADKLAAWKKDELARLTEGATEVVEVDSWNMPDEGKPKRTKKFTCAYWTEDYDGNIEVVWWRSAKEVAAEKDREAEEDRIRHDAENAQGERIRAITAKLGELTYEQADDALTRMFDAAGFDENVSAFCAEAVADKVSGWNDPQSWANIVRTFDFVAALLTDEERNALLEAYPETDGEEEDED